MGKPITPTPQQKELIPALVPTASPEVAMSPLLLPQQPMSSLLANKGVFNGLSPCGDNSMLDAARPRSNSI